MCNMLTAHQGKEQHTLEVYTVCVCVEGRLTRAMSIVSIMSFNQSQSRIPSMLSY